MEFKVEEISQDNNTTVKKSAFNGLVIGIIILVGVASFFAGSYTASINSNQVSTEDLEKAIAKLELKLLQNQLPTERAQAPLPVKISADQ